MFIPHPLTKVKGRKSKVKGQRSKVKGQRNFRPQTLDFRPQTLDFRLKSTSQRGATLTILTILSILFILSCDKDERLVDLTAVVANLPTTGAKVYVDNYRYACWHHGDIVNVNGSHYSLLVEPGSDYKVAKILDVDESGNGYTAAYPASCFTGIAEGGTMATVSIPEVQPYRMAAVYGGMGETYQQLVNPMVAHCGVGEDVLKFHNVGCVLKVNVNNNTGFDLQIHYATLTASTAFLAGSASVIGISGDTPIMAPPTAGYRDITVDCNSTPILLGNGDDTVLYVVSAPFENQSLTLRVLAKDPDAVTHGDTVYYTLVGTSSSPLSLNRNQMGQVSFEFTDCGCATETGRCDYLFWGCGTSTNPFLITSKADLIRLRNLVSHINMSTYDDDTYNKGSVYYKQILDVDISSETMWGHESSFNSAIGSSLRPFMANYDGSNHSVMMDINISQSGAGIGVALFGYVGNATVSTTNVIRNVVTRGSVQGSNYVRNYAGLVGFLRGSTRIVECVNYATISNNFNYTYGGTAGGICANVGWNDGSTLQETGSVSFENCKNYGKVYNASTRDTWTDNNSGFNGTGGICANVAKANSCTFSHCLNGGSVKAKCIYVGGLVGYCRTEISFVGENVNTQTAVDSGRYVGGIVGYAYAAVNFSGEARNEGTVKGGSYLGGIVGYVSSGGISVQSCILRTTEMASVKGASNCGGLMGYIDGDALFFSGVFVNEGLVSSTGSNVGGLVGYTNCTSLMVDGTLTNSGSVSAIQKVGGLFGQVNELNISPNTSVSNYGTVTGTGTDVGGIVGYVNNAIRLAGTVNNIGSVSGSATSNNVGGILGSSNTFLNFLGGANVSNSGNVSGNKNIGGIVGSVANTMWLNEGVRVLNSASVTGTNPQVGGVAGYAKAITPDGSRNVLVKNTGNVMSSSYQVGGIVGYTETANSSFFHFVNEGGVKGTYNVGGIAGFAMCDTLMYCINRGTVTATNASGASGLSGLIGKLGGNSVLLIDSCKNEASITYNNSSASLHIGGLVGYGGSAIRIKNSCNRGDINVLNKAFSAGGLIGQFRATVDTIQNCYNSGDVVVASISYVGGLATSHDTDISLVENCYFGGELDRGSTSYYGDMVGFNGSANATTPKIISNVNTYSVERLTNRTSNPNTSRAMNTFANVSPYVTTNNGLSLLDALNGWQSSHSNYSSWVQAGTAQPHLSWEDEVWAR